jgi:hypothetical protein
MKTSRSIEEQQERKAARDNGDQPHSSRELTQPVTRKSRRGDASRIAAWRWQPGRSANPGGVPKHDVAKEIAEAIFLNNPEMIYRAYCKMLKKGNAYAFQVLSDRAFGKLRETIFAEISPFSGQSDEELIRRIREIEQKLGYAPSELEPKILPPPKENDTKKPN